MCNAISAHLKCKCIYYHGELKEKDNKIKWKFTSYRLTFFF